jgi:hypothetical protein
MPVPYFLTILRLLIPLSILKWPLWGALASAFLDLSDWRFINFQKSSDYIFYQNWDKAFDLYFLSLALITTNRWKDKKAQRLAFFLFIYRVVGVVLFWLTGFRYYLLLFPNFFESFFFFYLFYIGLFKKTKLIISSKVYVVLILTLAVPKLVMEYLLHIVQKQMWQIYNFGATLSQNQWVIDNINFYTQMILFYLLPFLLGFFAIRKLNK